MAEMYDVDPKEASAFLGAAIHDADLAELIAGLLVPAAKREGMKPELRKRALGLACALRLIADPTAYGHDGSPAITPAIRATSVNGHDFDHERLVTAQSYSRARRIPDRTVRRRLEAGTLKGAKYGGRWFVDRSELR